MSNNLQRVHGTTQGVFHMDTANGAIVGSTAPAGTCVNFIGGAFDFFGLDLGGSLAAEMDINGAVQAALTSIAQTATVMMYQVDAGTDGTMSVAVYPKGAYAVTTLTDGSANLVAQLQAIPTSATTNAYNFSGATATNVGFKLATS